MLAPRSDGDSIYLLGAGGHGRVVLDALLCAGVPVMGILDAGKNGAVLGVQVLGGDEVLGSLSPSRSLLVNGVGANPSTAPRRELYDRMKRDGFSFFAVRHPSAVIGAECSIGDGAQIMAGSVVQNRTRIEHNVVVNTGAIVEHDCTLSEHAFVGPGAVLGGSVYIGAGSFVGAAAVVLPALRIGDGAVVGAGAVVTRDVPAGRMVVGNPAREMELRQVR